MGKDMKIIIPMAGEGKRFLDAGYTQDKASLPMIYRKTGAQYPMVICSVLDLPGVHRDGRNIAFVVRDFHMETGVDAKIQERFPKASFFSVKKLTQGQACTCLLAREFIDKDELLIAACDNGMEFDSGQFAALKRVNDVIVFTFRHNAYVTENPDAFGWVQVDEYNRITKVSVKKRISDTPENDHAIVATFWFRDGNIFVQAAEKMIHENDRVNNEFYVDQVIKHVLELGYSASAFEVERFLNYGTPADYENYCKMVGHFQTFVRSNDYIGM